jgi:hypothetical protein
MTPMNSGPKELGGGREGGVNGGNTLREEDDIDNAEDGRAQVLGHCSRGPAQHAGKESVGNAAGKKQETSASEGDSVEDISGKKRKNYPTEEMLLKDRLLSWFSNRIDCCPRYERDQVVGPLSGMNGTTPVMQLSF